MLGPTIAGLLDICIRVAIKSEATSPWIIDVHRRALTGLIPKYGMIIPTTAEIIITK